MAEGGEPHEMTQVPTVAEAPPAHAVADPIDWALAERVARRFAGREPLAVSYLAASLRDDFDLVTTEAEHLVAEYTGLRAPGPARGQARGARCTRRRGARPRS